MSQTAPTLTEIKEVIKEEISASEKRQEIKFKKMLMTNKRELTTTIRRELDITEQRIYQGIGDFLTNQIIPDIDKKADKKEVAKLEKRVNFLEHNPPVTHHIRK